MTDDIQDRLTKLIGEKQNDYGYIIQEIETMSDHVHLLIEIPPTDSVDKIIGKIKGFTSRILREEYPHLKSRLPSLWTRSKFVSSCGGVTLSVIKEYIEKQKNR